MKSFSIKTNSIEAAVGASSSIAGALSGRRYDATPPQPKVDVIAPPVIGTGKDGLPVETKAGVYSAPYWEFEITVHDDDEEPAWPSGVTVSKLSVSSFAFAQETKHSVSSLDTAAPLFPDSISDRQFIHGLAKTGLISMDEAKAWVGPGTLPTAISNFIASMPESTRDDIEMVLIGATSFSRRHPLTNTFGSAVGMTPQQLDQFWMQCAAL